VLIPLDNAVRIAPAGSAVRVTLERQDGRAVVEVSDHGPGFVPKEAERAFGRFWQGRRAVAGRGRGSGLGLSIARWILERHDGAIALDNHEGGGATVRLEVPLDPGAVRPREGLA
jgi:signal transduction histidine kinase